MSADRDLTIESTEGRSRLLPWDDWASVPWWGLILLLAGVSVAFLIVSNEKYFETFTIFLKGRPGTLKQITLFGRYQFQLATEGLLLSIYITLLSYGMALVLGLLTGLARVGNNPFTYTLATIYVEIGRGTPFVVLLLYTAFVLTPLIVNGVAALGELLNITSMAELTIRDVDFSTRAIIALGIGYGAYESEVFRGGIQSIERGQMEAARSQGMTYFQAMRYIILPQAIRRVLPPLGNDFIACLKDSSLATVLAVPELTQLSRVERSRTFRVIQVFNTMAYMYLVMTITLSLVVRTIERRLAIE